jgi:putative Holliday junction resolvase
VRADGTLLAFDFGEKRIGVAVGETQTRLAHPIGAIAAESNAARFAAIGKLVAVWKPAGFVVGRPAYADGAVHPIALLAEKFGRRLASRFNLPVAYTDETLSSVAAEERVRESGRMSKGQGEIDAHAAAVILEGYFEELKAHERSAS